MAKASGRKTRFGRTTVDLDHMGQVLTARRQKLGLSQRELAEKADVAPTTIHNLEHGSCKVQLDKFLQVLAALDLIPQQILEIDEVVSSPAPTKFESEMIELIRSRNTAKLLFRIAELLEDS